MGFAPAGTKTQGVIGLRMGYLAKHPSVRKDILSRLQVGEDLFQVASNIHVTSPGIHLHINLFADDMDDFGDKLETLLGAGTKESYLKDNGQLDPPNRDTPQGRKDFRTYWTNASTVQAVADAIRAALIAALESGGEIDIGWETEAGAQPTAFSPMDPAGAAHPEHVVFKTEPFP